MRRRTWLGLAVLAVLVLSFAGWSAWQANEVRKDLFAAKDEALALKEALQAGDQAAAERHLDSLSAHSDAARNRTDGVTWSILGALPAIGDDVEGVEVVSDVLADLADTGLQPLVANAADLRTGAFAPQGGRLDLAAISRTKQPIDAARGAFRSADQRLGALDTEGYQGSLRRAVDDLSNQVHSVSYGMEAASKATEVMPAMLGSERKRTWLLVFHNSAELRSTGGLPAAASVVTAEDGVIEMSTQYSSSDFPELPKPVLPLTKEERGMYDNILGTYFVNAGMTPSFARTTELMAAHMKRHQTQIDGVIGLDPVALSYMLEATGPVQAAGVTLTSDNAVEELLNGIYLREEDPAKQDAFFAEAARSIFNKFTTSVRDPQAALEALGRSARERRIMVQSLDPAEQAKIAGTVVGQDLMEEPGDEARIGFYLNDGTGSKMSYYLDYDIDARATGCRAGQQKYAGTFVMRSNPPEGIQNFPAYITGGGVYGTPPGEQLVVLNIYAPQGGTFDGVFIDGKDEDVVYEQHDGHVVATIYTFLKPQQRREITFRMTSGKGKTGETDVYVTPGVQRENESQTLASAC